MALHAADFHTGQAARAVIGQPSFSAREQGLVPTALSLANGKLYAADAAHRVLTFDLSRIPNAKEDMSGRQGSCALCAFSATAQVNQPVLPGVAGVAVFGDSVAIVDSTSHRALYWRNASLPNAKAILVGASELVNPISVALDEKRLYIGDAALHRVLVWNVASFSENQAPDAVLGETSDAPTADSMERPVALASDGVNLFVADAVERRILVFTAADEPLVRDAVVNSASLLPGPFGPGTLITILGAGLSESSISAPDDSFDPLPVKLGGVEIVFDGTALPLLSVSPTQLRAQLPFDIENASAASLYVRTEHSDGTVSVTNAVGIKLAAASPGLFAFSGAEPRNGVVLHGSVSAGEVGTPVTADEPAKPGEVLTLWAAGLGAVDSRSEKPPITGVRYAGADATVLNSVAAVVAGRMAEVVSAALPHGATGIYEVRVVLPPDLPADSQTELLIMQDGALSNTIAIPVRSR